MTNREILEAAKAKGINIENHFIASSLKNEAFGGRKSAARAAQERIASYYLARDFGETCAEFEARNPRFADFDEFVRWAKQYYADVW